MKLDLRAQSEFKHAYEYNSLDLNFKALPLYYRMSKGIMISLFHQEGSKRFKIYAMGTGGGSYSVLSSFST